MAAENGELREISFFSTIPLPSSIILPAKEVVIVILDSQIEISLVVPRVALWL